MATIHEQDDYDPDARPNGADFPLEPYEWDAVEGYMCPFTGVCLAADHDLPFAV